MSLLPDPVKRALLRANRLQGHLERLDLVSYEDRVRLRRDGYRRPILFGQEGQDRVAALIEAGLPLMVSRLGGVEMECLRDYLARRAGRRSAYRARVREAMAVNAGFFPTDDDSLDAFARLYLEQLAKADLMGVWFYKHEDFFCNTFCPGADLVENGCLEPFRFPRPWSGKLAGRKVLVIHPFAESITRQYASKRGLLFRDPEVLPQFELKTLRAVQSIAGSPVPFASWFEALERMRDEMEAIPFDVCLIGAGAYGLPLAACAKGMGKQAIHLGGVTQILFGIKGRRWEKEYADSTAKLFNEHWTRPLPGETPPASGKVEKGCYW